MQTRDNEDIISALASQQQAEQCAHVLTGWCLSTVACQVLCKSRNLATVNAMPIEGLYLQSAHTCMMHQDCSDQMQTEHQGDSVAQPHLDL